MKNIAIFSSGSGSNAENIIRHFEESDLARILFVVTDNPQAGVLERCKKLGMHSLIVSPEQFKNGELLNKLKAARIDLLILAGFIRLVPKDIVEAYPKRIINIHPALLPDYGGKGMYGMHVHRAVVENEEEETGITIHYVNDVYDDGEIIFQEAIEIDPDDSPEDVAYKVQQLEHKHYPGVIEWVLGDMEY